MHELVKWDTDDNLEATSDVWSQIFETYATFIQLLYCEM